MGIGQKRVRKHLEMGGFTKGPYNIGEFEIQSVH